MNPTVTMCPNCRHTLTILPEFVNVVCLNCGSGFVVLRYKQTLSLSPMAKEDQSDAASIDAKSIEIDELVSAAEEEIEALKSHKQSWSLQLGCSIFGLFLALIGVLVAFMLLGKGMIGGWLFYISLVAVLLLGLLRVRSSLALRARLADYEEARIGLERELAALKAEHSQRDGAPGES